MTFCRAERRWETENKAKKVIVCKYTSLFNFIMPLSQKQFFAVALEKRVYRLKYIPVIGFEELNKLAINSNYLGLILFVPS